MKTLIRFSTVKIQFLFHPLTTAKSLYVWHKLAYLGHGHKTKSDDIY